MALARCASECASGGEASPGYAHSTPLCTITTRSGASSPRARPSGPGPGASCRCELPEPFPEFTPAHGEVTGRFLQ
eukprot:1818041-Pyramimonas_sp.AAC.1